MLLAITEVRSEIEKFKWRRVTRLLGLPQPAVIDCFVADLVGHNRPVHEVFFPKTLPLEPAFTYELAGMTREAVDLAVLEQTQARLLTDCRELRASRTAIFTTPGER